MFMFWGNPCWTPEPMSRRRFQENQLKFLKWKRDALETRLAAINAAIETIERQVDQEEGSDR